MDGMGGVFGIIGCMSGSHTVRIAERVNAPFSGCRVDRENGVIYGALICGPESKNGNDYSRESFGDLAQYEGRHVYLNHSRDRRTEDKVGWFANVRRRDDGMPVGDFHVLKSHRTAESVFEAAERNASLFGFSHVAQCRAKKVNGRQKVEAVERVESIDLVAEPATTKGLFEGVAVGTTLGKLVESLEVRLADDRRKDARRWLVEMDGDPMMDAPAGDLPAPEADPDEALWSGFTAAITAILDQYKSGTMDAAAAGKEVARYVKGHAKLTGAGKSDEKKDDAPAESESAESVQLKTTNDQLTRENADLRVSLLAAQKGVTLSEAQRKVLARCDTDAERSEVLESFKPQSRGETPTSKGRTTTPPPGAKPVTESKGSAARIVWDAAQSKLVLN